MDFTTSLLTEFPSRRILSRHATRNAAALAMNDSRHGRPAQLDRVFGRSSKFDAVVGQEKPSGPYGIPRRFAY
jgi:hypothetical protein